MKVEAGQLVMYEPGYKCEIGKVNMKDLYPIDEQFARMHADMFENRYALEEIIKKKVEEN